MNVFLETLGHPVSERLGWSLIHLLWQGALVAIFLAGLLWALRRRSANARYLTAYASLLLLPVMLFVTFVISPGPERPAEKSRLSPQGNAVQRTDAVGNQSRPLDTQNMATGRPADANEASSIETPSADRDSPFVEIKKKAFAQERAVASDETEKALVVTPPEIVGPSLPNRLRDGIAATIRPTLPWIVAWWFLGLLVLSVWHVQGWIGLRRLRHRDVSPVPESCRRMLDLLCQRIGIRRSVLLFQSARVSVPSLLGFLKPVILLPGSVLTGLTPSQLEAVLAHELAHIRRNDYLHNLLQTAIETLLFFHPAVWWISRRIRIERENCCDDIALSITDDRLLYAQTLTRLAEMQQPTATQRPAALTVAASGGSLLNRIRRILGKPPQTMGSHIRSTAVTGLSGLLAVAAALFLMAPGMMSQSSLVSRTADPEPATHSNPAAATVPNSTKDGVAVNGLRLTLTADRAETTMLPDGSNAKPVKLKFTFTNVGKKPLRLNAYSLPLFQLKWHISGPKVSSVLPWLAGVNQQPAPSDYPLLQPGASWSPKKPLHFPGVFPQSGFHFFHYRVHKPGVYKLRCSYQNQRQPRILLANGTWTGRVSSNELELTVRPPDKAIKSKPGASPIDLGAKSVRLNPADKSSESGLAGDRPKRTDGGAKEQYRFLVVQGFEQYPAGQNTAISRIVTLDKPFNIRLKQGVSANGLLRKTKDGKLHYKGRVHLGTTAAIMDTPIELGKAAVPKGFAISSIINLFFVRFEKLKADGQTKLDSIRKAGADFLAKNKTKKGVVTTKSGLQYKILKAGTGKSPRKTDTVKIRFSGELIDGNKFAANQTRTVRVADPNDRLVTKGWTEALQLMKVGAKWKLFVPPDLGWGEYPPPSNVGPNEVLLFEIELLEIVTKTKKDKGVKNKTAPTAKPMVRAIDQRIMQIKSPAPKDFPQFFNSLARISEHDARRWFTANTITKLRTVLDFAKEDLVVVSSTREAGLKHLIQKSKAGTTVVFCAERRLESFDFTHWITRFYAVPRKVTLRYFARPDWEHGLSARLILRKKSYPLSRDPKSSPTLIDFDIEFENKSNNDVRLEVGAAGCQLRLSLNGPGAVNNVGPRVDFLKNRIYSKNQITIAANKKRKLSLDDLLQQGGFKGKPSLDDLRDGKRGYHSWAYWTKPGKYTLNVNFQYISGPQVVNKMPWVETFDFPAVNLTVLPHTNRRQRKLIRR